MTPGQSLNELAGRLFLGLERALRDVAPACVLVQGDTTTALAGAMSGFYSRIPVGHVEAGLRSGDMRAPYPEEFNRKAAALASTWHFAPTGLAVENLLREGIAADRIFLTGNTVVDALLSMREKIRTAPPPLPEAVEDLLREKRPYVLITGHRRENFGKGLEDACASVSILSRSHPECAFIYPVHLNPRVDGVVRQRLGGLPNVLLLPPCAYRPFLRLLDNCLFVMSDSGGVQEEAPSFGKRVLVMRETTERPEGVAAGFCRMVGTRPEAIIAAAEELFARPGPAEALENPYGDGKAAQRIVTLLEERCAL
jgi:UDP-N-acetylglucosamine 2-epimerase (non-hydrolysing)